MKYITSGTFYSTADFMSMKKKLAIWYVYAINVNTVLLTTKHWEYECLLYLIQESQTKKSKLNTTGSQSSTSGSSSDGERDDDVSKFIPLFLDFNTEKSYINIV